MRSSISSGGVHSAHSLVLPRLPPASSWLSPYFALTTGSRDAALVTTLEPGAYSAQIRGGSATETGEVLLEVYFID